MITGYCQKFGNISNAIMTINSKMQNSWIGKENITID